MVKEELLLQIGTITEFKSSRIQTTTPSFEYALNEQNNDVIICICYPINNAF